METTKTTTPFPSRNLASKRISLVVIACLLACRSFWKLATIQEELQHLGEGQPGQQEERSVVPTPAEAVPPVQRPPQSLEDSFSACLMLKDNNIRLVEWVAYHFYALPLRTLVIYVDPYSRTHPREVLQKWEPYIDITYWDQVTDIGLPENHLNSTRDPQKNKIKRQEFFLASCAWDLRSRNRTWALMVDVDEYLRVDRNRLPDQFSLLSNQPGFVSELLKDAPSNGTVPSYWLSNDLPHPTCLLVPRRLYAGVESAEKEVRAGIPHFLDAYRFNTARFRHWADLWHSKNDLGKSLIRVDRWTVSRRKTRLGVHRPIKECPSVKKNEKYPFKINHYLSSWETFSGLDDPRFPDKTEARRLWEETSQLVDHPKRGGHDDAIRSWIANFVDWQGEEAAQYLLSDIGPSLNSSTALFKGDPYVLET